MCASKDQQQRLRRNIHRLAQLELLEVDRAGERWDVTMLRTDGSGEPWRNQSEGAYIRVPVGLIRHGWLAVLSTRAVTTALVMLDLWARQGRTWPVQYAPEKVRSAYAVSPDAFRDGADDLRAWGLASFEGRKLRSVGDAPDAFRTKSMWLLDVDLLQTYTPLGPLPGRLWPKLTLGPQTERTRANRQARKDELERTATTAKQAIRYRDELQLLSRKPVL
jgi:hypothetical protein